MIASQLTEHSLESLIDIAILEIEVAPSLRDRARKNLAALAESDGRQAIEDKITKARDRKRRAGEWLAERRRAVAPIVPSEPIPDVADPYDIKKRMWRVLQVVADKKEKENRVWAGHAVAALKAVAVLDEDSVRSDLMSAQHACEHLLLASKEQDFTTEATEIQAMVFTEIANLCTLRGMVTNERGILEEGLELYNTAANNLARSNSTVIATVVQFNRGVALRYYMALVAKEYLDPLDSQLGEVIVHLSSKDLDVRGSWVGLEEQVDDLREDLVKVREISELVRPVLTQGNKARALVGE